MQLFCTLNELGTTVLIATHDLELVRRLGRRTLVLRAGSMIADRAGAGTGSTALSGTPS